MSGEPHESLWHSSRFGAPEFPEEEKVAFFSTSIFFHAVTSDPPFKALALDLGASSFSQDSKERTQSLHCLI